MIAADTTFIAEFVSAIHRREPVPEIDFGKYSYDLVEADMYKRVDPANTKVIGTFCRQVDYNWIDSFVKEKPSKLLKTNDLIARMIELYRRSHTGIYPTDFYAEECFRKYWGDLKMLDLSIDADEFEREFSGTYPRDFYFLDMVKLIRTDLENCQTKENVFDIKPAP